MEEATTDRVNFFIYVLARNNIKATQIHDYLVNAFNENVKSLRRVQELVKDFNEGNRLTVKRKEGSGRPVTKSTDENIQNVREIIENDPSASVQYIATTLDIPNTTVLRILRKSLLLKSLCARWIPYSLTDNHKRQRVQIGNELIDSLNGNVVVVDEKWLYCRPLPPIRQVREWVGPDGDRPRLSRRIMSDKKFHIIVACNFRGNYLYHVFPPGENVNAERYVTFVERTQQLRRSGHLSIMHDNARPHTAAITQQFFHDNNITHVVQPPYSPDFNLLDRYVFRNMEYCRRDQTFNSIADVEAFLEEFMSTKMTRFKLNRELFHLINDLQAIVAADGDYL